MSQRTHRLRQRYPPNFKLAAAKLVVEKDYPVEDTAEELHIGKSTLYKWVKQLRCERAGRPGRSAPISPELRKIRELEKKIRRIEREKERLARNALHRAPDGQQTLSWSDEQAQFSKAKRQPGNRLL